MFRLIRRFFRSSHPLDAANLGDRVRDIKFRVAEAADIPTCMGFYRANEEAHFPPGRFEHYESQLRNHEFLTLLAMREDIPVGCCGINYAESEGIPFSVLCFGMVHPTHQRQGIGTAQLLVRLAMLTVKDEMAVAAMYAVPGSVSFYSRFGVRFDSKAVLDDGHTYPFGVLKVSQSFIDECCSVLAQRNITYPDVKNRIPQRQAAPEGTKPSN